MELQIRYARILQEDNKHHQPTAKTVEEASTKSYVSGLRMLNDIRQTKKDLRNSIM